VDVAFFMNTFSALIGVADFESDGFSADAADDASLRPIQGGACHNMVLLADCGINRQNAK
jgi:hypothetical protein